MLAPIEQAQAGGAIDTSTKTRRGSNHCSGRATSLTQVIEMNTGPRSYEVNTQLEAQDEHDGAMDGIQEWDGIRVVSTPMASVMGVALLFASFNGAFWYLWHVIQEAGRG